jgi:mycoredoxin-dependent peroxiredoxin
MGRFKELGAQVLGISSDTVPSHKAFAKELGGVDFPILSDFWPHGEVARRYGVFMEETGHPRRSVFVLDKRGVVRWAYHAGMDEQRDVNKLLEALEKIRDEG